MRWQAAVISGLLLSGVALAQDATTGSEQFSHVTATFYADPSRSN